MNKHCKFQLILAAGLTALASCSGPEEHDGVLIANVNIVDTADKTIRLAQDILIRDDRIVAIADTGSVTNYSEKFDAAGAYATAGLYDAHTHIDTSVRLELMLPEIYGEQVTADEIDDDQVPYMAYGITGIVVFQGNDDILAARERARENDKFIPRILTAGPILDGPDSHNPVHLKIASPEEGIAAVNEAAEKGYDFIKPYHIQDLATRNAIIERAVELGLPVAGHVPPGMSFDDALVPGFSNVAHAEEITRTWDGEDADYFSNAVRLMAEHKISFTPHLVGYREIADEIEDIEARLASLDWALTPPLARVYAAPPFNGYVEDFGGEDIRERAAAYFRRIGDAMDGLVLEAHHADVMLLAGTDVGNPTMFAGQALYREMALLKGAGLDGYDVIAAATINPAKLFGEENERGSIAIGKVADIALFDINPVEADGLERGNILAVVKNGVLFDRDRIEAELTRVSANYDAREKRYFDAAIAARGSDSQ